MLKSWRDLENYILYLILLFAGLILTSKKIILILFLRSSFQAYSSELFFSLYGSLTILHLTECIPGTI